jgi:NAD(P)-dependent dehydrogenase (short-subunit alcohol dehydrogenase family)
MPLLVVIGYGPGNGHAIAERFGREGWTIALVGRHAERLHDGVEQLAAVGVTARPFTGDAGDPVSLRATLTSIRGDLGPVTTVALTAYRNVVVDNVLAADPGTVAQVFDIGVTGLLTAVQTTLDDLRAAGSASVLVVNGALGLQDDTIDEYAVSFGGDGVALECSAKTKLVGLLAARLRTEDIYVGEIVINGSVKGSPYAGPTAVDPADIADRLWRMAEERTEVHVHIAEQRA